MSELDCSRYRGIQRVNGGESKGAKANLLTQFTIETTFDPLTGRMASIDDREEKEYYVLI